MSDILITSRPDSANRAFGNDRGPATQSTADVAGDVATDPLCLAATPIFAIMALLTGLGGGEPDVLCAAMLHASPFDGMTLMYLLMSVFHARPWLKLICGR